MTRSLAWDESIITECDDGTICENRSKCVEHPYKEGKYICDCLSASNDIFFAGLYCEFKATEYCGKLGNPNPTFCANMGTCRKSVGRSEEHVACQCKPGYMGDYCQFVEGSMPSDWELSHFMHPALLGGQSGLTSAAIAGITIGTLLATLLVVALGFMWCGRMNKAWSRNDKEMDTNGGAAGNGASDFIGGKSLYKSKRNTTGAFAVTSDTLEADGGVLTDALQDKEDLQEVDLNDLPSSLELEEETVTNGELA